MNSRLRKLQPAAAWMRGDWCWGCGLKAHRSRALNASSCCAFPACTPKTAPSTALLSVLHTVGCFEWGQPWRMQQLACIWGAKKPKEITNYVLSPLACCNSGSLSIYNKVKHSYIDMLRSKSKQYPEISCWQIQESPAAQQSQFMASRQAHQHPRRATGHAGFVVHNAGKPSV